jgi:hypothetical protein
MHAPVHTDALSACCLILQCTPFFFFILCLLVWVGPSTCGTARPSSGSCDCQRYPAGSLLVSSCRLCMLGLEPRLKTAAGCSSLAEDYRYKHIYLASPLYLLASPCLHIMLASHFLVHILYLIVTNSSDPYLCTTILMCSTHHELHELHYEFPATKNSA